MTERRGHRVVLITGAAGALGSELACACARVGWETILIDRNHRGLESVRKRIRAVVDVEPILQPLELAALDPQQSAQIVRAIEEGPGRLDALVHCAASFEGLRPADHVDPSDWMYDFQVNVHAAWLLSVHCLPLLRLSSAASLFFLIDDLDRVSGAYWGAYGVTKRAVETMAAQFSVELQNSGIRVLAIDPGPMRSALRAKAYHSEDPTLVRDAMVPAMQILAMMEDSIAPDTHCVRLCD